MIFLLDGVNTKKYMRKYVKWLIKNGMDLQGSPKYIHHTVDFDGIDYSKIHLGKNIVISKGVIVLIHDFSIEAGLLAIGKGDFENESRIIKDVSIGENSFIGARTVILPGARIGKNCIVGAGSNVAGKDFPDNSVIVGNPAKVVMSTNEWINHKIERDCISKGNIN